MHTKGQFNNSKTIRDWINYMLFCNVLNYDFCCNKLKEYDTVGHNLLENPEKHYSGNFWWSNTNYIKKLNMNNMKYPNDAEFLILLSEEIHYCIHNSNKNYYHEEYKLENYKNIFI